MEGWSLMNQEPQAENTIGDRLKLLLQAKCRLGAGRESTAAKPHFAEHGFWLRLAASTSVPSARWRNFFSGNQKVTPPMIDAAAKLWPQHAFWLAAGLVDLDAGHTAPAGVEAPLVVKSETVAIRFEVGINEVGESRFSEPKAHGD